MRSSSRVFVAKFSPSVPSDIFFDSREISSSIFGIWVFLFFCNCSFLDKVKFTDLTFFSVTTAGLTMQCSVISVFQSRYPCLISRFSSCVTCAWRCFVICVPFCCVICAPSFKCTLANIFFISLLLLNKSLKSFWSFLIFLSALSSFRLCIWIASLFELKLI